jgi:ferric-dicitrate binding protein FerR (iron transport regulator)
MSSREELEHQAARFLIEQDDPNFSDEQRAELTRWMMQSVEHCKAYLQLVRSWRWTVLLYRDDAPRVHEKSGTSPLQRALDRSFG